MHSLSTFKSLLLNASYEPMKVLHWQKGMLLWLQDKVEVLEFHSAKARTVSSSFQLPSILRLKTYIKPRPHGVRFCRENVYLRDQYTCQYCRIKFAAKDLTLDHVVPASQGGEKSWTNVVTACRCCNQKKANRTPKLANMPLLKEPRPPTWLPSFENVESKAQTFPLSWIQYLRLKTIAF